MKNTTSNNKKNVTLTVRVSERIKELFDKYCEAEGRQQKWVASKAIEDFLKKENFIK